MQTRTASFTNMSNEPQKVSKSQLTNQQTVPVCDVFSSESTCDNLDPSSETSFSSINSNSVAKDPLVSQSVHLLSSFEGDNSIKDSVHEYELDQMEPEGDSREIETAQDSGDALTNASFFMNMDNGVQQGTSSDAVDNGDNTNEAQSSKGKTIFKQFRDKLKSLPIFNQGRHSRYTRAEGEHPNVHGAENDGVFANITATSESGDPLGRGEEELPSYDEAAADSAPTYWESTVVTPGYEDEVFVEGLPVGNLLNFFWNLMVSVIFQYLGFVLTYLLHTSHAAKEGSCAGLGITIITLGFDLLPFSIFHRNNGQASRFEPAAPNDYDVDTSETLDGYTDGFTSALDSGSKVEQEPTRSPIAAYALIALGMFLFLRAIAGYFRAKRMERLILNPVTNPSPV
ncbi:BA75_00176T0 [Komagataella pastoris]|uniref:BA75_00176T0 n=1 Tax=Komagataella pastoris TaxID=4922 RepID=A0A1B2J8B9_PICPA|nr:BA75_00176T0 [Komagataella pastoris]